MPRCDTISGVQNVTLYCKIYTVIQKLYKWSLVQGLYRTLDPLISYPVEPEISTTEQSAFCTQPCGKFEPLIITIYRYNQSTVEKVIFYIVTSHTMSMFMKCYTMIIIIYRYNQSTVEKVIFYIVTSHTMCMFMKCYTMIIIIIIIIIIINNNNNK